MSDAGKRAAVICGVALALVPLLLFTYFGLSMRLLGDDYEHLGYVLKVGTWEALLHFRGSWNGHYSSFLFFGLSAPLGAAAPPFFAFAHIAIAFAAFGWVVNAVLRQLRILSYRRAISVALAALAVATTINGFYSAHSFYWYSSAVLYTWPTVFLLIGIALAAETERRLRGHRGHILATLAAALYAFLNAGFAEMYLVYQLSVLALITLFAVLFQSGSKRKIYLSLALAASLGTLVGLAVVLNAPGFANRSDATIVGNFLSLPIQQQLNIAGHALNETLIYAGHQEGFAGFMLVAFAGLFVTLSAGYRRRVDTEPRRRRLANAPFAFALLVQLMFVPILWSHISDSPRILSRFSYGFATVIGINLLLIAAAVLALGWRRRLNALLQRRNGLMIYCSSILLAVCLLFIMTQVRTVHVKASAYLFFTVLSLLIMLGGQLAGIANEPSLNRLFLLTACVTAGAIITLASIVSVEIFLVRFVNRRSISAAVFALMLAGMLNGVTLGALIRHGFLLTGANAIWLRLGCLLVALAIGAGIVIGHGQRIGYIREYVEIWESQHREIIRMRDAGDPAVYTMNWKHLVGGKMDQEPPVYERRPLTYKERIFYGLEGTREYE